MIIRRLIYIIVNTLLTIPFFIEMLIRMIFGVIIWVITGNDDIIDNSYVGDIIDYFDPD